MTILDRINEITRKNFEEMAKIEVTQINKPKNQETKVLQKKNKKVKLKSVSGIVEFNLNEMDGMDHRVNGKDRYYVRMIDGSEYEVPFHEFKRLSFLSSGYTYLFSPRKKSPIVK